jgi:hypothetical protein
MREQEIEPQKTYRQISFKQRQGFDKRENIGL